MGSIKTQNKEKIINQDENILSYFKLEDIQSSDELNLSDVNKIITNAKEKILIASTGSISNDIIRASYPAVSKNIPIYIILKSFDTNKEMLLKYDKKQPAIIREVRELENNFIVVDDKEFLFLRNLNSSANTVISIDTKDGNDLFYWFNYYFWNLATQENFLEKLEKPKESPYPYFIEERKNINIKDKINNEPKNSIFPHDSKFRLNCENYDNIFISKKIDTPFYFDDNFSILGNFIFNKNFSNFIMKKYKLQRSKIKNISTNIIPFDEDDWTKEYEVQDEKIIKLKDIRAINIDDMEKTEPEFIPYNYSRSIRYEWHVLPPIKDSKAKRAKLYSEYEKLKVNLDKYLDEIKIKLESIKESISSLDIEILFKGKLVILNKKLIEVKEWKEIDLKTLSYNELEDKFKENGDFFKLYDETFETAKEFEEDLEKERKKSSWEKNKEKSKEELKNIETEIERKKEKLKEIVKEYKQENEIREELKKKLKKNEKNKTKKELKKELKKNEKNKTKKELKKELKKNEKNKTKLKNEASQIVKKIRKLFGKYKSKEIDYNEKYNEFIYCKEENEIEATQKHKKGKLEIKFSIPKYQLPEVGNLFENDDNYYLEIENYEDLKKANEIAKYRYSDKKCKVVAKNIKG